MVESEQTPPDIVEMMQRQRERLWSNDGAGELASSMDELYHLWWRWADFHLYLTSPSFPMYRPPRLILPALIEGTEDKYEFVYPILDFGNRFSTSKGSELYSAGLSMWRLYCTIEKIIGLLIQRLQSFSSESEGEGGSTKITEETEVQVAFAGHELAQRKGFESIINLSYNVVVTNFDPGMWGERYLQNVKRLAEKGYGYPSAAPRDFYKTLPGHAPRTP
jgi:hypothetical protein